KQILEQAKMEKLFQRNKNNNFYQSNSDAFKWK
ncbi:P-type conjugative transfer protein TrbJ, partial [Campylobacter coli]|nr:P-type conjugative transfer protein TrbJ [Campylobacter coli]ECK7741722.1 P-type conjugative transfer protein TrbJ [Campylobacter coli]ECK7776470.1 P-type conjugative transfer protein TrbJ [Campylobacter coli]EDD2697581.1 P-type conjugative transfer protein TrbJ [Campylobacter coli]